MTPNGWDQAWRARLVENLAALVQQLWSVGLDRIFIDGSFVDDKPHPNDIYGYFECDVRQLRTLVARLNASDPQQVWTWDDRQRTPDSESAKRQLPMWHIYRVELYPHYGQLSGIRDPLGHELEFPSAFRQTRGSGSPKGIVQIVR